MHFIRNTLRQLQRRVIWAVVAVGCLAMVIYAQTPPVAPHKPVNANKPVCSAGAICFSGEVSAGEEFQRARERMEGARKESEEAETVAGETKPWAPDGRAVGIEVSS
jgi:hypothetical protein